MEYLIHRFLLLYHDGEGLKRVPISSPWRILVITFFSRAFAMIMAQLVWATIFAASIFDFIPPFVLHDPGSPPIFSIALVISSTPGMSCASLCLGFLVYKPLTSVRRMRSEVSVFAATRADNLSLSPKVDSISCTEIGSFSFMIGIVLCFVRIVIEFLRLM